MTGKKQKSLGKNALLNGLRNVLSILFPLITFPYVSRVLQVDNLGKYNFALSTVNYFILIAGLGISTYAIREGARYRDNKEEINCFASEVFSINLASMFVSYLMLISMVILVPKFHEYSILIFIFSLEILFKTIGTEWVFNIYEEYGYITKRSIAFQLIAIVLLFLFVKDQEDYFIYAGITVIANAGNNLLNFINVRKHCKISLIYKFDWKKHLKPIFLIFATSIATTIYVNSDITILGFMATDYNVGLYSVSVKIYKIIKTALSAVLVVSIPRLSNYIGTGKTEEFNETFNKIFNIMIMYIAPAVVGLFMLSDKVIFIIADKSFAEATTSLRILSIALFVCLFGWLFTSCVLIPHKKEKNVLIATIFSAVINIILNVFLIPLFKQDAAAFTTLIAEGVSMGFAIYYSRGLVKLHSISRNLLSVLIGCIGIVLVCMALSFIGFGTVTYTIVSVAVSVLLYALVLIILKNPYLKEGLKLFRRNH